MLLSLIFACALRTTTFTLTFCFCLLFSITAESQAQTNKTFLQKKRTFHTVEEFKRITGGKVKIQRSTKCKFCQPLNAKLRLPVLPIKSMMQPTAGNASWLGTHKGALRVYQNQVEYFAGMRWLPDDNVTGLGMDLEHPENGVWIETPKGYSRIIYEPTTLEEKSRVFVKRVQDRHNRWGFTSDSQLKVAGDLTTNQMVSSDNDGLWTAMYVAAECFRYKVTGDADARENARTGMKALIRLEEISGIAGFPARSIIKKGVDIQPGDGEWHDTPDGLWRWKGDTSSDEIVGHYFVYPIYFDLVATEDEKPILRGVIDRMTNHILDNNYQLIDLDGKHTLWGWWGPDKIWDDPDETGLRALHMLSHLRVALHMTANDQYRVKYRAAYNDLINNHKYHLLMRNQKIMVPGRINHSDDELAFLSYYPLLSYETDSRLREVYQISLERSWQIERMERNPLWNYIYAAGTGAREYDASESLKTLQEIPQEQIEWTVTNSHRLDVTIDPVSDRHKRKQALTVLPYDELPMSKWNGNPYQLDGGSGGRSEDDGAYFLLPYWMGRYHKLIGE